MQLEAHFTHDLNLRLADDGRLLLSREGKTTSVKLRACFPWSNPQEFLSLRDDENHEHALVRRPEDLDPASRAALQGAMAVAGFAFEVKRIREIEKDFELRVWKVETAQGPRQFATALEDWPRELPDGRILIEDLSGDIYVVTDRKALDGESRRLLWAYTE
ncbi:MAG: DUF1854 domain-containing protein [Opitutales bacterium]